MTMVKIEFEANEKGFETANYLLSLAIDQAKKLDPALLKTYDLSKTSLKQAEAFRKKMVKGFFNPSMKHILEN